MPLELQVIRASEFVRLDARESLDFEASKRALEDIARGCQRRGLECALLDLRALPMPTKPLFTPTELAGLVSTFREAGFSNQQRLAVLYREDIHHGIRNFAFISRMSGLKVQGFDEFEKALQWLSKGAEAGAEYPPGEVSVPILRGPSEEKKMSVRTRVRGARVGRTRPR